MRFERFDIFSKDETHPSCHASFIHELPNGELMAIWYAGKAEAHKSVCIKACWKPLDAEGNAWSTPVIIHKTPGKADGNAILTTYKDKLYLFHNVILGKIFPWTSVSLNYKTSMDNGRTWSKSRVILGNTKSERGFTVRNKAIVHEDKIIIPTGQEKLLSATGRMLISEDGEHFRLSQEISLEKGRCIQPTIVHMGGSHILAFLRTDTNWVYRCESHDMGETWSKPEKLDIHNPNSALDCVLTPENENVLVWNNTTREKGGTMKSRKVLHVGYSKDGGRTWPVIKEIERDDRDGRFAYPSIILGSDGNFHLTYTNRRKTIRYVIFDKEWLLS